mgnify:CR=1 FL=1
MLVNGKKVVISVGGGDDESTAGVVAAAGSGAAAGVAVPAVALPFQLTGTKAPAEGDVDVVAACCCWARIMLGF